jgi:hypothetical protein
MPAAGASRGGPIQLHPWHGESSEFVLSTNNAGALLQCD